MINRCKNCDSPCPSYSDFCKTCAYIEEEERLYEEEMELDKELEEFDE